MRQDSDRADQTLTTPAPAPRMFAGERYVAKRVLGEGSQKRVFLVRDTALDRDCALASFRVANLDAQGLARLHREASSVGRIGSHPNIVTIFSIGDDDGLPYVVSEYVAGGDLRQLLRSVERGILPISRAIEIGADVASGLAAAHAHGIVHRDIKPANVLLTPEGTAKLADFGLAAAIDRSRITQTGSVVGTASYMAPEQALGGDVDHRSDIYSLGALLYELTTGRPPFLGDDPLAVVSQHIQTVPVIPSWHNREIPPALDAVISGLLAKAPDDRPRSADEVVRQLRRLLQSHAPVEGDVVVPAAPLTDLHGLDWGRFAGRGDELGQLNVLLTRMLTGQGGIALIAGEPGIGKTRLARELCVYGRLRGAQVLTGRCDEGSLAVSYRPFIEALRQYVRTRPDDLLRDELGDGAPEIAALISEVRTRFTDIRPSHALEGDLERLRLFDGVAQFLHNASLAAPLILFLDDLQWADRPSLLLLAHLARETAGDRVLLLGTYRDAEMEAGHPLASAITALRRAPSFDRITLDGLPLEAVRQMLTSLDPAEGSKIDGESLPELLFRETEGNPFFVREIVSYLVEEGLLFRRDGRWQRDHGSALQTAIPGGVREVVGRRLDRLSARCRDLLARASALAGGFSWQELDAISDDDESAVLDALDEALAAQLIAERLPERAGSFDFTHGLIRQTLYRDLSAPRRILLHRKIGTALEGLYAESLDTHAPELAHHFFRAARGPEDLAKVIDYARRAARRALSQYAHEDAIAQLDEALEILERVGPSLTRARVELLVDLGGALKRAGRMPEARSRYEQAAGIAREHCGDLLSSVCIGMATIPTEAGVVDQFLVELTETALRHWPGDDRAVRARLLETLAEALVWSAETERRISLSREAVATARSSGDVDALLRVLNGHRGVMAGPAYTDERLGIAREMASLALQLDDPEMHLQAQCWEVVELVELGGLNTMGPIVPKLAAAGEHLKQPQFSWYLSVFEAMRALTEGRLQDAEPHIMQGLARGQKINGLLALQLYGMQIFALRWMQGRIAEVEGAISALATQYAALPALHAVVAFMYAELGRDADAREHFEVLAADDFSTIPVDSTWLNTHALLALVCAVLGDEARAPTLYRLLLPFAARTVIAGDAILSVGSAQRYLANLASLMQRTQEAEDHFEEALRANRAIGARPFVAVSAFEYAAALARRGSPADRERCRALLEEAAEIARAVGMPVLLQRCEALSAQIA